MDSFKSGAGVVTIVDTVGLVVVTVYFCKQNRELRAEIEALRKKIADLQLQLDSSGRDTRAEFKRLRKSLSASTPASAAAEASAQSFGAPPGSGGGVQATRRRPDLPDIEELSAGLEGWSRASPALAGGAPLPARRSQVTRRDAKPPDREPNIDELSSGL